MLWVGIGGMIGAILRYRLGLLLARITSGMAFPLATWAINLSGSFALGILVQYQARALLADTLWLLLAVGFLGAYTTFSTFGYELLTLLEQGKRGLALFYAGSSVLFGVLAAWGGYMLVF